MTARWAGAIVVRPKDAVERSEAMQIGAAMFFTDYSMSAAQLAQECEARGFESVWAPEHSHIPLSRTSPFPSGGELPKQYSQVMDPFVTLSAAAAVTKTIKLGTGVCLVIQRDPIQTAKLVASLDQVSRGRFLFGVGGGWNAEEMADHGTEFKTRFKLMRERIEAMKEIWTGPKPEYHGEMVDFPPMMTWPKPVQKPYPPVIVGGMFPHAARRALRYGDGWIPHSRRPQYEDVTDYLPQFKEMAAEAGRDLASVPVTVWGIPENLDRLRRYEDQGVARGVVQLAAEPADTIMPILDRWAGLIRQLRA
jgi:probable F420-dependent oxidoreductase